MTREQTPSSALAELAEQHARLRDLIARCDELADELDAGPIGPTHLLREVARLRVAVRVSRMVEDHVEEHRAMRNAMRGASGSAATSELRAVLASLREHLESEERYFLTRRVLRDDLAR